MRGARKVRVRREGRRAKKLALLTPTRESYCRCLDFSAGWSAIELISTLMTIQHSYPLGDWSIIIAPIFYEFRFWKKRLIIVRSVKCFSFFFFLNCLTVAKQVLGRTHTLSGTTVEVSRHSITDKFQAKDGSGDQVRPTTEPFKLPTVFHLAWSIPDSKSFFQSLIA